MRGPGRGKVKGLCASAIAPCPRVGRNSSIEVTDRAPRRRARRRRNVAANARRRYSIPAMSHAVLVAAMLGLALHSGDRPPAHPADGPDIDVRLRIGPGGVTMALLLNLAFVDEVVDTPRESETALHPVEYESYHQDLAAHFLATNRVEIDGVEVTAEVGSFEVGEPDLTLLPLFPRMGVKALLKMRLLLEYPASAAPERVSVVWGTFPDDLVLDFGGGAPPMNINVQVVARGVREHVLLSTEEPGYTWHDTGASALDAFDPVPLVEASTPPGVGVPLIGVGALCAGVGLGWLALRQRRRPLLVASLAMFGAAALGRDAGRSSCRCHLRARACPPPTRRSRSSRRCSATCTARSSSSTRARSTTRWRAACTVTCSIGCTGRSTRA